MKRIVMVQLLAVATMLQSSAQIESGQSKAAQDKGVQFIHNLSWQEVFQKAQKENKYVFVDCYASWCGPCKWMDKNIYPIDSVGTFMNERFISVRMQMDTAAQDNDEIRQWYAIAHTVGEKYHIGVYPSYLFFSPNGQAIHKDGGSKNISDFLSMAKAAMNPEEQYYTLLADYRSGNMTYTRMPTLAYAAQRVGQDSLSKQVCLDYMHHHLETLSEEQLWIRENILFVYRYSSFVNVTDKIFQLYYQRRTIIDSVMHGSNNGHFSDVLINRILYRDEVKPQVDKALTVNAEPRWNQLEKAISRNYDVLYAKNNVLQGRVEYYKAKKNWKKYIKYFVRQQEISGIESWPDLRRNFDLNNNAYEVFKYDNSKRDLEKALSWVNRALAAANKPDPEAMDTKANLLYKLGKKSDGLVLEEISHSMSPKDKEIAANYEKMKSGLPTWVTE